MNAHVQIALEEIAKETGAIIPCEICGNYDVIAFDDDAEAKAYGWQRMSGNKGHFALPHWRRCAV